MRKPQVAPVFCLWPHFQFAPSLLVYSGWIQFVQVLIPSHQPLFLICHPLWEIEHARMLVQVTKKSKCQFHIEKLEYLFPLMQNNNKMLNNQSKKNVNLNFFRQHLK